jgi:hypothetical protein
MHMLQLMLVMLQQQLKLKVQQPVQVHRTL